jgi:hypothetical protein
MTDATRARLTGTLLAVAICAILVMSFYIRTSCSGDGHESFTDKHEWSIMQEIDARHPNHSIADLEFIDDQEDYHIVGIPDAHGKATWVMLNPRSAPYYKQSGGENYSLSEKQLQRVVNSRHVISTVENCLGSHVPHTR